MVVFDEMAAVGLVTVIIVGGFMSFFIEMLDRSTNKHVVK